MVEFDKIGELELLQHPYFWIAERGAMSDLMPYEHGMVATSANGNSG